MKPTIALFKFGERRYMEEFRKSGMMYMNTVQYFRELEGCGDIGDEFEGLGQCFQSDWCVIEVTPSVSDSFTLSSGGGLVGQVDVYNHALDSINIFCMYALRYSGKKPVVHKKMLPPLSEYDTYVCISNREIFRARLLAAVSRENKKLRGRLVEYVSRRKHNGTVGVFRKFDTYDYQSEYRLALFPGLGKPYTLILGDISDITVIGDLKDINQHIDVKET